MVVKPQKTKFQLKIVENIQTISIWANNPWRRYSISLITLLIGYFFGSSLGMVSAVVELMDPVAAFLSLVFIEILIVLRRNFRSERKRKFLVLFLDSLRLGLFYGFFPEPGELRGIMAQLEALHELLEDLLLEYNVFSQDEIHF